MAIIVDCRNCSTHKNLEEFRSCMKTVRNDMKSAVEQNWEDSIEQHLLEIKADKETCGSEITTLPPIETALTDF